MSDTNDNSAINDFNRSHAMTRAEMPPRLIIKLNADGLIEAYNPSFVFKPFPPGAHDYISVQESQARESRAREEGRAAAFKEMAGRLARLGDEGGERHARYIQLWAEEGAAASRSGEGE